MNILDYEQFCSDKTIVKKFGLNWCFTGIQLPYMDIKDTKDENIVNVRGFIRI